MFWRNSHRFLCSLRTLKNISWIHLCSVFIHIEQVKQVFLFAFMGDLKRKVWKKHRMRITKFRCWVAPGKGSRGKTSKVRQQRSLVSGKYFSFHQRKYIETYDNIFLSENACYSYIVYLEATFWNYTKYNFTIVMSTQTKWV